MNRARLPYVIFTLMLMACGSSSTDTGTGGGGGELMSGTGGKSTSGTSTTTGSTGENTPTKPAPPILEMVMPMAGVLHVEWSSTGDCNTIEGERKDPTTPYAVAFSVSATKKSYMDPGASQDMEYTYRLRCKIGESYSDYSSEKSANPTKTTH